MRAKSATVFIAIWAVAVVLTGGILTSYHMPFNTPGDRILALAHADADWQAIHVLSGGCGCSQRVLAHLRQRGKLQDIEEQIVMVDGAETDLPGTSEVLAALNRDGFPVRHLTAEIAARDFGLRGVPLLAIVAPGRKIAYLGGYGTAGDPDGALLRTVRAGNSIRPLPAIGCAVGAALQARSDPWSLKYRSQTLWQTLERAWSAPHQTLHT